MNVAKIMMLSRDGTLTLGLEFHTIVETIYIQFEEMKDITNSEYPRFSANYLAAVPLFDQSIGQGQ